MAKVFQPPLVNYLIRLWNGLKSLLLRTSLMSKDHKRTDAFSKYTQQSDGNSCPPRISAQQINAPNGNPHKRLTGGILNTDANKNPSCRSQSLTLEKSNKDTYIDPQHSRKFHLFLFVYLFIVCLPRLDCKHQVQQQPYLLFPAMKPKFNHRRQAHRCAKIFFKNIFD